MGSDDVYGVARVYDSRSIDALVAERDALRQQLAECRQALDEYDEPSDGDLADRLRTMLYARKLVFDALEENVMSDDDDGDDGLEDYYVQAIERAAQQLAEANAAREQAEKQRADDLAGHSVALAMTRNDLSVANGQIYSLTQQLERAEAAAAVLRGALDSLDHSRYNCISEQGRVGLLWTVWDGTLSSGRRVASFAREDDARQYMFGARAALADPTGEKAGAVLAAEDQNAS